MHIKTQQEQDMDNALCMEDAQSSGYPNYKQELHYKALKVSILV